MQGLLIVFFILLAVVSVVVAIYALLAAIYTFNFINRLRIALRQAGLKIGVYPFVGLSLLAGLLAGLLVFLFSGSLAAAIMMMMITAPAPSIFALDKRRRRFLVFLSQLPDALELMALSLQAGQSFISTLKVVATEMPEPIACELGKAYEEQILGLNMKSALENLVERVPILDLKLCVTALLIHREIGGALLDSLLNISHTIRERSRIERQIRVKSAQARWPCYVLSASPFWIFFSINLVNPTYMKTFYNHKYGVYALGAGAVMQIAGWLIIRKIFNIQESPSFFLYRRASNRKRRIMRAAPDALELMIVCVEAGLDVNAALQRVEREMELVEADLSEELAIANREIRRGKPRDLALRDLGVRTGVDDIKSLAATLAHTDRLETSTSAPLRAFADYLRKKRLLRVEKLVVLATIKLIFPLLLCIFPALMIVLIGPSITEISDLFKSMGLKPIH
ncbi:MAG: type II secretion system F family protein [Chloracidobacterium sp.]|nr:type II secretion system F family protein [Chloracidobacterium sp.]